MYGPEDSVKSFCDVAFMIADGRFPTKNVHRAVDVELSSGQSIANVPYREIESYIRLIAKGEEDFLILISQDGFLQFYGVGDQFVAEMRVNLPNGDFRTYSLIDQEKARQMERIQKTNPIRIFFPLWTKQGIGVCLAQKIYLNCPMKSMCKSGIDSAMNFSLTIRKVGITIDDVVN